jgi:DNA-binding transcriptional ArsR family regulator
LGSVVSTLVDDQLWSALGDPTRRRMLDLLLVSGEATATTLGERLPVSRQAVAKHLDVLDRAGLVHGRAVGREKRYRAEDVRIER